MASTDNAERQQMLNLLCAILPLDMDRERVADALLDKFTLRNPGEYHGTYARWQREVASGKKPCAKCQAARKAYRNERAKQA